MRFRRVAEAKNERKRETLRYRPTSFLWQRFKTCYAPTMNCVPRSLSPGSEFGNSSLGARATPLVKLRDVVQEARTVRRSFHQE